MLSNSDVISRFHKRGSKRSRNVKVTCNTQKYSFLGMIGLVYCAQAEDRSGCARWKCRATNPESQLAMSQPPETETK